MSLEKIDNFINSFLRRFYTLSILLLRVFLGLSLLFFHGKSKFPLPPQKLIEFFWIQSLFGLEFVAISEVFSWLWVNFFLFLKRLFR